MSLKAITLLPKCTKNNDCCIHAVVVQNYYTSLIVYVSMVSVDERYILLIWISNTQFAVIQGEEKTDHQLRMQELAWNCW